jgi:hypothetical protein
MYISHGLRAVAIFAVGAATGWIAATHLGDSLSEFASVHDTTESSLNGGSHQTNSVEALPGGLQSLHADSATLASLQSELQRQGSTLENPTRLEPSDTPAAVVEEADSPAHSDDTDRIVSSLRNGTDQEGIAALTRSLQQNVEVPVEALRETAQYGASSNLRLLAYRMYVDAVSDDSDAASAALNLGASSNDPNVRTEALARLAEFEQMQQATVPQTP